MKNIKLIRSIILLSVFLAFVGSAFAQSATTLRARCPNTSVYSIVQITGVGDINVQPCANKTTTFTQNVVLPAGTVINGGNVSLANGTAAAPSLRFLNSLTTGAYRSAADVFGIATAGVANATFGAAADTFRSASHVFSNVAGTAEFGVTLVPSDTVGTLSLGDCAATNKACITLTQTTDTITYGAGGTATISDETGINKYSIQKTNTAAGTTGAQTINKPGGTVNVAAGQASIVVTNNTVTTSSLPFVTLRTADATCTFVKSVVPTANTLTITLNAACGAETSVAWFVLN